MSDMCEILQDNLTYAYPLLIKTRVDFAKVTNASASRRLCMYDIFLDDVS